jgi:hypothetical protein
MPTTHPAAEASTIVSAGKTAWSSMLEMNAQLRPGVRAIWSNAPIAGNQCSPRASQDTSMMAMKK